MDPDMLREIREAIRAIPDYPNRGVTFRDITTLLGNARVFRAVVDQLVQPWLGAHIDRVAGIEARDSFSAARSHTSCRRASYPSARKASSRMPRCVSPTPSSTGSMKWRCIAMPSAPQSASFSWTI